MDQKPEQTFRPLRWDKFMLHPVLRELFDKNAPIPPPKHKFSKVPTKSRTYVPTEADDQLCLKQTHPYHVLAMDHYNKNLDNEAEYKISSLDTMGQTRIMCFGELGFLRHLFWKAVPKNAPSTVEPKIFYARVHEMFEGIHVPFCDFYSDSVDDSDRCEICGLKNSSEFWKKDKELKEKEAEKAKAIHSDGYLLHPINLSGVYQSLHRDKQTGRCQVPRKI